jgi:YD repeat-containing protein
VPSAPSNGSENDRHELFRLADEPTSLTDPDGGIRTFSYDLNSRLSNVIEPGGGVVSFQYDLDDRETTFTSSSGLTRHSGYDSLGQVVSLVDQTSLGAGLQQFAFSYDAVGNRIVVSDSAGALATYSMDAKSRLTGDTTSGVNAHVYTYSYDQVETESRLVKLAW